MHDVARGNLHQVEVDPAQVFRAALLANAHQIIVAHNHPSGDPTPTIEDIELTRRLTQAGEILGIKVLDHIVIGLGCYCSFKETGRL